jgi:hypothetical protein
MFVCLQRVMFYFLFQTFVEDFSEEFPRISRAGHGSKSHWSYSENLICRVVVFSGLMGFVDLNMVNTLPSKDHAFSIRLGSFNIRNDIKAR